MVVNFCEPQHYIVDQFPGGSPHGGPDSTRPIPQAPAGQIELRTSLAKDFPVKVQARRLHNGTASCLSLPDCRRAFERLRAHAAAYVHLHEWGMLQPRESCTPSAAVTFWYTSGSSQHGGAVPSMEAQSSTSICPEVVVSGLKSAAACFDVVELLCYQSFASEYLKQHVPSLQVLDASEYVDEGAFKKLFEAGVGIRTLADVVRVRRLLRRGGGWFVDCDCHWMQRIGNIDVRPPQFGHLFATNGQKGISLRMSAATWQLHQELNYLAAPQDCVSIASPFAFPPGSLVLAELVQTFVPRAGRNPFMEDLRQIVQELGLQYAYAKPEVCSPLPYLLTHARVLTKPARSEDVEAVRKSICANAFWSSTASFDTASAISTEEVCEVGSQVVCAGSVWDCVLHASQRCHATPARRRFPRETENAR